MSEIPVYDPKVLTSLIGDDQQSINEYKSEFLKQCVPSLRQIAAAFNNNDKNAVKEAAHYLKTSAKAVGALRCANRLQEIEDSALAEQRAELKQHITLLQQDIRDVKKEFI
ncbi:Hpt domain-containing protein [Catenovulum agarivorans]|uniref:Hpt domain-containing protein n=1 Tax=Catenovulum agarivorans TaxID=1172192 RepID=UPI0002D4CA52|nr:Hpt domain-containing protein [Catenovulum agarivorans]